MTTAALLYSIPDAAEQLSVSARVLERLIKDGEVDTVKIGRRRLVPAEALADYVERLRRSA
jgi:excisionase family DNA binding protein